MPLKGIIRPNQKKVDCPICSKTVGVKDLGDIFAYIMLCRIIRGVSLSLFNLSQDVLVNL